MFLGKIAEEFRHACGHPTVAASPVERRIGSVIEEAVGLLQLVKIGGHRVGGAVKILNVVRGAIGLNLDRRNHVHVIYPVACFCGDAIGRCLFPLLVGQALSQIKILSIFRQHINLKRDDAEDAIVNVSVGRDVFAAFGC